MPEPATLAGCAKKLNESQHWARPTGANLDGGSFCRNSSPGSYCLIQYRGGRKPVVVSALFEQSFSQVIARNEGFPRSSDTSVYGLFSSTRLRAEGPSRWN